MSPEQKPAGQQAKEVKTAAPPTPLRLGPDHRDLYLLIVGVAMGILLGPAVLGRVAPPVYQGLIVAGGSQQKALVDFDADTEKQLKALAGTDVTAARIQEVYAQRAKQRQPLEEAMQSAQFTHEARSAAVLLAILALMVFESMLDPISVSGLARWRGPLATARYALMALWLVLVLADPAALMHVNPLFVVLLVVLGAVVTLAPLGWIKRR